MTDEIEVETPQEEQLETEEVVEETQTEEVEYEEEAEHEEVEETETEEVVADYYTPEEMRELSVDDINTSKIPPEMQALYKAMQAPITKKNQELAEKRKALEQGNEPLQDKAPDVQVQQPSINEMATKATLEKLGLETKPEAWEDGYDEFLFEVADTRQEIKANESSRQAQVKEFNDFQSGFEPEKFKEIDARAETKMYQMMADPSTRQEGQRLLKAVQTGDVKTVLAFVRETAKEVLSTPTKQNKATPPSVETPSGKVVSKGSKHPDKMTAQEYRDWRMGSA